MKERPPPLVNSVDTGGWSIGGPDQYRLAVA